MKIGILSLPLKSNYGGLLQSFALQKVLKNLGYDNVESIKYTRPPKLITLPLRILNRIKFKIKTKGAAKIFPKDNSAVICANTQRFISENISQSQPYTTKTPAKDFKKYDAYIVGSDQIWRFSYFKLDIPFAYLNFVKDPNALKIAYASSFGVEKWQYPKFLETKCSKLAKRFDAISVREDIGVDFCKKFLGVEAFHVLDPTMLLEAQNYIDIINSDLSRGFIKQIKSDNILFSYILDESSDKTNFITKCANILGLKVHSIMPQPDMGGNKIEQCIFPPVSAWLQGFQKSKFVITDSFHGIVFSIIFNKSFIAIANKKRGIARFYSILKLFKLESRLIFSTTGSISKADLLAPINWNIVNAEIANKKKFSLNFLNKALSKKNNLTL